MAKMFWNVKEVLFEEFVEREMTINSNVYYILLKTKKGHPEHRSFLFLNNNAHPHTAQ